MSFEEKIVKSTQTSGVTVDVAKRRTWLLNTRGTTIKALLILVCWTSSGGFIVARPEPFVQAAAALAPVAGAAVQGAVQMPGQVGTMNNGLDTQNRAMSNGENCGWTPDGNCFTTGMRCPCRPQAPVPCHFRRAFPLCCPESQRKWCDANQPGFFSKMGARMGIY